MTELCEKCHKRTNRPILTGGKCVHCGHKLPSYYTLVGKCLGMTPFGARLSIARLHRQLEAMR